MINRLLSHYFDPLKGWDPVSSSHAANNAQVEWAAGVNIELINYLENWLDGFENKKILDLGGGPGHYTISFAQRGAEVYWHDISRNYEKIAKQKALEHGVKINTSLGYMDHALDYFDFQFDLVFNRICWYYCFNDKKFCSMIIDLIKPGGYGYVDTMNSTWKFDESSASFRLRTKINNHLNFKIGHPFPPHGRIARQLQSYSVNKFLVDYSLSSNDRILFQKGDK